MAASESAESAATAPGPTPAGAPPGAAEAASADSSTAAGEHAADYAAQNGAPDVGSDIDPAAARPAEAAVSAARVEAREVAAGEGVGGGRQVVRAMCLDGGAGQVRCGDGVRLGEMPLRFRQSRSGLAANAAAPGGDEGLGLVDARDGYDPRRVEGRRRSSLRGSRVSDAREDGVHREVGLLSGFEGGDRVGSGGRGLGPGRVQECLSPGHVRGRSRACSGRGLGRGQISFRGRDLLLQLAAGFVESRGHLHDRVE